MKSSRIWPIIKTALYFISFAAIIVACNTEQGMMNGGGRSMNMGNWNWVPILIGVGIVLLLVYFVARRRK